MARASGLPPAAFCERIVAVHVYGCVAIDRLGVIQFANPAAERCIACQTAYEKQYASNGTPSL